MVGKFVALVVVFIMVMGLRAIANMIPFRRVRKWFNQLIMTIVVIMAVVFGTLFFGVPDQPRNDSQTIEEFLADMEEFKEENGYYPQAYYNFQKQMEQFEKAQIK